MKLIRNAFLTFSGHNKELRSWEMKHDDVVLSSMPVNMPANNDSSSQLLVIAEVPIEFPEIDEEGCILIPEHHRKKCEQLIEKAADIFAVLLQRSGNGSNLGLTN